MASSVAQPGLERQFAQIPHRADDITSSLGSTRRSRSSLTSTGRFDAAPSDVKLRSPRCRRGQLPKNLPSPPTYRKVNPADIADHDLSATSARPLPLTQ